MLLLLLKLYAVQGLFVKYERAVGASPMACTHGQLVVANWPIRARDLLLLVEHLLSQITKQNEKVKKKLKIKNQLRVTLSVA